MSKTKTKIKELNKKLSKKDKKYKKARKQLEREKEKYMKNKSVRAGMKKYPPIMNIEDFFYSLKRHERDIRDKVFTTVRFVEYEKSMYTNIYDIRVQKDYYRFSKYGFDKVEIFLGIDESEFNKKLLMVGYYRIEKLTELDKMRFPTAKMKLVTPYLNFIKTLQLYYEHQYQIGYLSYPKTDYLLLNIFYSVAIKITSKDSNLYLTSDKEVTLTITSEIYRALFGEKSSFNNAPNNFMEIFNQGKITSCFNEFFEEHISHEKEKQKEEKHDKKRSKKEVKETSKKTR